MQQFASSKRVCMLSMIFLAAICLALSGCSKVTQENYEKIKVGMTYEQVTDILGKPTASESGLGMKHCVWKDGEKAIDIKMLADKVVFLKSRNLSPN